MTGTAAVTEHEVLSAAIVHERAPGEATPPEIMSTMASWHLAISNSQNDLPARNLRKTSRSWPRQYPAPHVHDWSFQPSPHCPSPLLHCKVWPGAPCAG